MTGAGYRVVTTVGDDTVFRQVKHATGQMEENSQKLEENGLQKPNFVFWNNTILIIVIIVNIILEVHKNSQIIEHEIRQSNLVHITL